MAKDVTEYVRITDSMRKELLKAARKEGVKKSEIMRRALAKELGLWSPDKGITL